MQSSFPSIRESVYHIVGAEWIWLKRWQGISPRASTPDANVNSETLSQLTPVKIPTVKELPTVAALRSFADAIEQERQKFLSTLTDDSFSLRSSSATWQVRRTPNRWCSCCSTW